MTFALAPLAAYPKTARYNGIGSLVEDQDSHRTPAWGLFVS